MIKAVLNHINGVDLYAILSLGLFMSFFIGMLFWVCSLRKTHLKHMQQLPLDTIEKEHSGDNYHA